MDFTKWQLKDTQTSQRGAKSCQLRAIDGSRIFTTLRTPDNPVQSPFGATIFGDAEGTRKTLELNLNSEHEAAWDAFDEWAKDYLTKNSFQRFQKLAVHPIRMVRIFTN